MTNSTTEYWDINGTSLQTLGWGIAEWSSGQNPPTLRGDGVELPYRIGRQFQARVPEPRTLTFDMWVSGKTEAGVDGGQSQLITNWEALRALFWGTPGAQLTVTKRWSGGTASAAGSAVFAGGLEPESIGLQVIRFSVDLLMLDPYFYGSVETKSWGVGTTTLSTALKGTAPSPRYTVTLPSGSSSLTMKQSTTNVSALTATGLGGTLAVTFPDMTFTATGGAHPGLCTADGDWVAVSPSATSAVVTGGTIGLSYYPAYV